jgi:hypothetical protein
MKADIDEKRAKENKKAKITKLLTGEAKLVRQMKALKKDLKHTSAENPITSKMKMTLLQQS